MFRSLIAAASLFLVAAPSAMAHPNDHVGGDQRGDARYEFRRSDGHEWRELHEARERFYSRRHSRWEERRFERWFASRVDELRLRRY